jgi:hypothetical protein
VIRGLQPARKPLDFLHLPFNESAASTQYQGLKNLEINGNETKFIAGCVFADGKRTMSQGSSKSNRISLKGLVSTLSALIVEWGGRQRGWHRAFEANESSCRHSVKK